MFIKSLVYLLFIGLSSLTAQTLSPNQIIESARQDINEIKILAVMVEFQKDDFELTYGDGTFGSIYSQDYGNDILDPLPHDKNYFEDHLQFAENYYHKVSNGKVKVSYTVLPDIYTVTKTMREYSPVEEESFKPLGDFSKEVWEIVDNANSALDFEEYNTFVIFHAGVGKDISTSELFGEARDLPSIFLGLNSLREFYGESFEGFQVGNSQLITNTMILPETESREETNVIGTTLLELSINGLIVSSIASRIGLPDLFDAETGKSAIGRFGLMDGQSLFAYAGLFPPEPSAWEKIFLGWEEAVEITDNSDDIMVTASRAAASDDNVIYKIPINSTEYFLVENRNRDVNNNGINITYKVAGETRTINFSEDLDNFNNAFADTLKGVVLDVDEYDWALPGSGILIWHIDEKIIADGINRNRVNVGESRGVDLEEADGIQDIGEEFQTIFGDIIIAEGDEFDLWYSGNSSELYNNSFSLTSKPDSRTNSGANSLIEISGFSSIGPGMTLDVSFGSSQFLLQNLVEFNPDQNISNYKMFSSDNDIISYVQSNSDVYRISGEVNKLNGFSESDFVIVENGDEEIVIGAFNNTLNISLFSQSGISNLSSELTSSISAPIVAQEIGDQIIIYAGLNNGTVEKYTYSLTNTSQPPVLSEAYNIFDTPIDQLVVRDDIISAFSGNRLSAAGEIVVFPDEIIMIANSFTKDGKIINVILIEDNSIYTAENGSSEIILIYSGNSNINGFALGDLKNNGENYIAFNELNEIKAINYTGAVADNFPVKIGADVLMNAPLIADLNSDGALDIISAAGKGDIFAVSGTDGLILSGFPLTTGGNSLGKITLTLNSSNFVLTSITQKNEIYSWILNSMGKIDWGNKLGNNFNNPILNQADDKNFVSQFFPVNRTYNWPNPVYDNETFIRTYVGEDSDVKVKVFDLAGDLVDEFNFFAQGGLDTDFAWNVADIESGAYFAHIEVKSGNGKTDSKIIKIAVVK